MYTDLIRIRHRSLNVASAVMLCLSFVWDADIAAAQQAAAPSPAELSALRYYSEQGDKTAVEAELRRLRESYPSWTPPEDMKQLGGASPAAQIDRIYKLIASGDLGGAQNLIKTTQTQYPNWTPPADMITLLNTALAQRDFDTVVGIDPQKAADVMKENPALTRCDRINNVWRLAAVQAASNQPALALGAYQAIIKSCPKYQDVRATLQKADAVSSPADLDTLFSQAAGRFPDQKSDLDSLQQQLRAGRGNRKGPAGGSPLAASAAAPKASASERAKGAVSEPLNAMKPSTILGADASRTTAASRAGRPSGGNSGSIGAPVAVPYTAWSQLPFSGDRRLSSMRAAAAGGNWASCLAITENPRSLDILNERGWCSLNAGRPLEAVNSFAAVLNGRGVPVAVQRDARYGLAMTYLGMKMPNDAARVAAATNFTEKQRVTVESEIMTQRAIVAYDSKDYRNAIGYLNGVESVTGGRMTRNLQVLRAYAYLNMGDKEQAHKLFEKINSVMAGEDTRRGLAATEPGE